MVLQQIQLRDAMDAPTITQTAAPAYRSCGGRTVGWGKDREGNARRKCKACGTTFGIIPERPLGSMRLDLDKTTTCLSLLVEGSSIRSTERVTGVHRDTMRESHLARRERRPAKREHRPERRESRPAKRERRLERRERCWGFRANPATYSDAKAATLPTRRRPPIPRPKRPPIPT
jgi:transposase-like protein